MMNQIRRRGFLKLMAATLPALLSERSHSIITEHSIATIKQHQLQVLVPYIDTLLPADESPSASELNIHHALVEHALGIENYVKLLSLGCAWMDARAGGKGLFARLKPGDREQIVTLAETTKTGKIERLFFDRTYADIMRLYYSHPKSWPTLGFTGPPQPIGFPDYRMSPK